LASFVRRLRRGRPCGAGRAEPHDPRPHGSRLRQDLTVGGPGVWRHRVPLLGSGTSAVRRPGRRVRALPPPSSDSTTRTPALLEKFYFAPRTEPVISAKPLGHAVSHALDTLRCAEIGPKIGPKNPRRSAGMTRPTRPNPHQNWVLGVELAGLEPATSWVRSRRALALNLACLRGFRGGGGPV
jgi:hypothetical protein